MRERSGFLKTTALGGLFFLIPFVIVVLLVGKALAGIRNLVSFLEQQIPGVTISGIVILNLIAIALLIGLCFLAGLYARGQRGQRLREKLDTGLAGIIPGYAFLKNLTEGLRRNEEQSRDFKPVLAKFDDNAQIAFEIERSEAGVSVVYLPGCPDPWSGSVVYLATERVTPVALSVNEALKSIRRLGADSAALAGNLD